jgi:hypothetical protein
MEKPLYNQGDLLQYQHRRAGIPTQLLVITKVFTTGRGKYGDIYYTFTWCDDGSKNTYQINTLDDDLNFKLVARGQ